MMELYFAASDGAQGSLAPPGAKKDTGYWVRPPAARDRAHRDPHSLARPTPQAARLR